jgi:hypothetical protein
MLLVVHPISEPAGTAHRKQKSENYTSVQGRLYVKVVFLCWYYIVFASVLVVS